VIYVSAVAVCLIVLVIGWAFHRPAARKCPHCAAQVQLGKARCQTCGYMFSEARF
jgi:rubredoxin